MPIPTYEAMLSPMLALHADDLEHERASIRAALAGHFHLSQDDLEMMLPSGTQRMFDNRVNWAAVYLAQAGLLERPRRGATKITPRGREVLARYPDRIDNGVLAQFAEFKGVPQPSQEPYAIFQRGTRISSARGDAGGGHRRRLPGAACSTCRGSARSSP
jgi:restriction system protein